MPVRLGELLLKENMVSPQQLQDALNHAKLSGGKIGKAFVSLGFVRDDEITRLGVDRVSWRGAQFKAVLVPTESR